MKQTEESWNERSQYLGIGCLLIVFYAMTRALNHSESYDSINYALFAENFPLGSAPDSRNILFHVLNRLLFLASEWMGLGIRTLELISFVSIVTGAWSLILFARLMKTRFGVSSFSAWTGTAFLGLTYGYWRYTSAAEVYMPSIFLILCSLTLIFKFLDNKDQRTLFCAGVVAGFAVLLYQPNIIVLFVAAFCLFCSPLRFFSFVHYCVVGAIVVIAGLVLSQMSITGSAPTSFTDLVGFVTSRNHEFRDPPCIHIAMVKLVLAFGHDLFSAHWTQTLDPVRNTLAPHIPGCVYNFNVVVYAGKGIQCLTVIASILFVPLLFMFARVHYIASRTWKIALPNSQTLFLVCWLGLMGLIVGVIDPGSFEAWIPVLIPFAGLLTVLVIEPCYQMGKRRTLITFLLLMLYYNFFGGIMLWQNTEGDYFFHKTAWIRQELTENDTVILNEFDYRAVDYLHYYSDARIAHLNGDDLVTFDRSHPEIHSIPLDEFVNKYGTSQHRLFTLDSVLTPSPQIRSCRSGEEKYAAAIILAERLKKNAVMVNSDKFGQTYEIKQSE